jgi:hypothetical protein
MFPANGSERPDHRGIGNVRAIPGYQEIHAVHRRNRDVRSVCGSFAGDLAGCQTLAPQPLA